MVTQIENGKTYRIKSGKFKGEEYWVEGLWNHISGQSWGDCDGNPACIEYAIRGSMMADNLPDDDNAYYGKIGMLGHIIHESEIGEEVSE